MSKESSPKVIPPPGVLATLGPLVVVEGECAYYEDKRATKTAFALPGYLSGREYQRAMDIGMRRSGTVVYRPLCEECRKCQPLRVPVADFKPSKSQRRIRNRCDDLFTMEVTNPVCDDEHLELYSAYQRFQHGKDKQDDDAFSYRRFLVETVTDTIEMQWRDKEGKLIAVGVLDATPTALSSVYFYWDPALKDLSLGTYSALVEIELCKEWSKTHYYLGYLVAGSRTMSYKASFEGAEVWNGNDWLPLESRSLENKRVDWLLKKAELDSFESDARRFRLHIARTLPRADEGDDSDDVGDLEWSE